MSPVADFASCSCAFQNLIFWLLHFFWISMRDRSYGSYPWVQWIKAAHTDKLCTLTHARYNLPSLSFVIFLHSLRDYRISHGFEYLCKAFKRFNPSCILRKITHSLCSQGKPHASNSGPIQGTRNQFAAIRNTITV